MKIDYDTDLFPGLEIKDKDDGEIRYIKDNGLSSNGHIQTTTSDSSWLCVCEAWYTLEEVIERWELTGKKVDLLTLDENLINCNCENENEEN